MITDKISGSCVCFEIKSVTFMHTDFQEEGLYYAMTGWLAQRYSIELPAHEAFYDEENKIYAFPDILKYKGASG